MSKKRESEYPEIDEDINYRWDGPKYNAVEMGKKSKLFVRKLSKELLDAADYYICNKAQRTEQFNAENSVGELREKIGERLTKIRSVCVFLELRGNYG
jgi:hypothetical protein